MNNVLSKEKAHIERIIAELQVAGISKFGLRRFTSRYLPKVIHEDEHIKAAVFGRQKESEGFFGIVEGALVATDKRILFIDHRPGYTTMDEISYEVVSGVNATKAGPYSSITLFTKITNYQLSFARSECVSRFALYIERHRLDENDEESTVRKPHDESDVLNNEVRSFLDAHELGVLSSIDRTGVACGAVIYFVRHKDKLYFMTKTGTKKALNIVGNQHVALTVFDEKKLQTAQVRGIVEAESDNQIKSIVSDAIIKARQYESGSHLPPVMWLGGSSFITFRITPTDVSFNDYSEPLK